MEGSRSAVPEIFPCPDCGGDIELWSDETQRQCPGCGTIVTRKQLRTAPKPERSFSMELKEVRDPSGQPLLFERYESVIPISLVDADSKNKIACEACHKFGKNFACPPYSPNLDEYTGSCRFARVICIRLPQEYYIDIIQENMYKACFRQARAILVDELLLFRQKGYLVGGCGYCQECDVCGAEKNLASCLYPDKMIYSLESMGVNLTSLTRTCFGFDLEWSGHEHAADFVCSIGAVFLHTREEVLSPTRTSASQTMNHRSL